MRQAKGVGRALTGAVFVLMASVAGALMASVAGGAQTAGTKFRDCPECPLMVVVPSGSFMMGSPEAGLYDAEGPVHRVTIARPFAVGVYEVTFGEWDACVSGGGCGAYRPDDEGWGRGDRPVIRIDWDDAQAYVRWLSGKTGKKYRLLSESEWEYVARAGTGTRYWWGDEIGRNRANCYGCGSRWDDEEQTAPVGSFPANAFGLHDVHGNVSEWVEDCWNDSYHGSIRECEIRMPRHALVENCRIGGYQGVPRDGSAWKWGGMCARIWHVQRGGSWNDVPGDLRSAHRRGSGDSRIDFVGFRVALTLTP